MSNSLKGVILVVLGAAFWGIGGTVSERLFRSYHLPLDWFITIRLFLSGFLLLILALCNKQNIWIIFKEKHSMLQLFIYGIVGMFGVQYTFLAAIHEGNAAVATLLQYLAPIFILVYLLLTKKTAFSMIDLMVIMVSSFGTFLLLTGGHITSVKVSLLAIFWGILSGMAAAFYTMYATRLFKWYPSLTVIGWAMVIASVFAALFNRHWHINPISFDIQGQLYFIFVIVVGTALAFWLYLLSVKYIEPQVTALLGCIEPLTSIIISITWLNVTFNTVQFIGMLIIIGVVLFISIYNNYRNKSSVKS
ncbi:DMT family transporter [Macrococcus sp. DPC7161]|uniref:EamA family transporter n=1 Tax=Macrococcus sp. DPC7161 TaxID=2507060 RepID=UPI00100B51EB|nr:DMT family transporter [Macrococcus sp. DPC7161]RXK18579.1 EamA family transporter [Macrococcus sp. DPC7161]